MAPADYYDIMTYCTQDAISSLRNWKVLHKFSTDSGTERSNIMLTRVAIIENVKSEDGKSSTPVVLVPAEEILIKSERIRETMLVKYAKKLEGKDLNTIEVVRSDFTAAG